MSMLGVHAINIQDFRGKMIRRLLLVLLLIHATVGKKNEEKPPQTLQTPKRLQQPLKPSQPWLTLSGKRPVVIARGGYSGLYPESSAIANGFALQTSLAGTIIYCSLLLSKDGIGFCNSNLKLDNTSNIADVFPDGPKSSYLVNGQKLDGYFAVDYNSQDLSNISLIQNIFSRPALFDEMGLPLATVEEIILSQPPVPLWLDVQYPDFYLERKLDPALYIDEISKTRVINYISSPDIGFLKTLNRKHRKKGGKTQLIFVFLEKDAVEPTTNKTYGSLLKDLATIKQFASGILVPKDYIWPVNPQMYLEPPTTLLTDAHKQRLQVFAYPFANDFQISYNYSYDPNAEYLQFIDNSQFSVDGFLTDFPSTASGAIACLAHNKNATRKNKGKPLVISHNGASGVYPGCTDLAYQQAVEDGADIIDCSVQLSKDGVPFCLNSTDLASATSAKSTFLEKSTNIPEIQGPAGIFSFELSWEEIQTLKPLIASPFASLAGLQRNPANKSKGKFVTLAEFLEFSKQKKVSVLINIKNAPYLASEKGMSITDAVESALKNASLDKPSKGGVWIQSDDSAVLSKFASNNYKRILLLEDPISEVPKETVAEIKKVANAVSLTRTSVIATTDAFTETITGVVQQLRKANVSVIVSYFMNEFYSIAQDYLTDPMVEIATFTSSPIEVDGIVTDYPATANAYLRNHCTERDDYSILPVRPGDMLMLAAEQNVSLPPAAAPAPALQVKDVVDPPLPPVSAPKSSPDTAPPTGTPPAPPPAGKSSGQSANVANLGLTLLPIMLLLRSLI